MLACTLPLGAHAGVSISADGNSRFIFEASAGSKIHARAFIMSNEAEAMKVSVYPVDAHENPKTEAFLPDNYDVDARFAKWIGEPVFVTLEPFGKKEVPFIISIPANTPSGMYIGALMVQKSVGKDSGNFTIHTRVGARIYLKVLGEVPKDQMLFELADPMTKIVIPTVSFPAPTVGSPSPSVPVAGGNIPAEKMVPEASSTRYSPAASLPSSPLGVLSPPSNHGPLEETGDTPMNFTPKNQQVSLGSVDMNVRPSEEESVFHVAPRTTSNSSVQVLIFIVVILFAWWIVVRKK